MSNRLRHTNEWIAPAAMPSIRHCKRIAITVTTHDPQADALGPGVRRDGYVAGLAIATDDGRSHYLPIAHDAGGNMDPGLFWHWCRSELARFSGVIVGANLIDALDFLAEQNVCFSNAAAFHDVQVAACLLDETRAEFNLSALAIQYLGKWRTDQTLQEVAIGRGWKNHRDIRRNLWRLHSKNVGPAAEDDAADPLKLMDIFLPQMEAEGLMQVWDVERKLLPILLGMRRAGVRVDVDKAEQAHRTLVEQRSEALREVRRFAGPKAELMAPRSLAGALIDRGVHVPLSASGEPSITKGLLERHKNDPLAAAIMRGRRLAYIADAVVGRYILTHAVKGRIHAEFNQIKTDGKGAISRFSATNPNLQGIVKPEDDEDDIGAIARSLMLPEEGEQWVRDDVSQADYRFLAHYASGPGANDLRAAYNSDPRTDYHAHCARVMRIDPADKVKRKRVKTANFLSIYGGGEGALAGSLGISIRDARGFLATYHDTFPFVRATSNRAQQAAEKEGFIRTVLGRRQRFPMFEPARLRSLDPESEMAKKFASYGPQREQEARDLYGENIVRHGTFKALNYACSGGVADLQKAALVKMYEAGIYHTLRPPLVLVHDETGHSANMADLAHAEAMREAKQIMETAVSIQVPIVAEREIGPSWGEVRGIT